MRNHVPSDEPNEHGGIHCVHCGAMLPLQAETTCNYRHDLAAAPRAIPPSALDDNDAMHARIVELRAERDAEMARKDESV